MKKSDNILLAQGVNILREIQGHGFEAFFVGGCVRDYLLTLPIRDIDITTSATPKELLQIFPELIPIGIEHGTVLVKEGDLTFEITTYRGERSYNSRNPQGETTFAHSLEVDVSFRDFTMNALAMDCELMIIDHHNGQADLQSQIIRAVGNPLNRMKEDPLRVLRGIRFMSQFDFTIEEHTNKAMEESAYQLESVATERLLMECEKIFTFRHSRKAIETLLNLQIDKHLPVFKEAPGLLAKASQHIKPFKSFAEVMALMHLLAPHFSLSSWCNHWKCSNRDRKTAKKLVNACIDGHKNNVADPFFIYSLEGELGSFYRVYSALYPQEHIQLEELRRIEQELTIRNRNDLAIKGNDIIQLFPYKRPGKWIDDLLTKLEINVVSQHLENETMTLKEWITCNPPETN